ncbi:gp436 family protein [Candidatus Electronema sp. JM]|uniref:gp436 family protein n=1 Tax=Candidatus Electronema sp. JM TaxID=3401571 RepID=UPI003AA93166
MYADFDDLTTEIDRLTLIRLTDDDNLGEPNQHVCALALVKASERIDSKIGMRYPLPLAAPLPGALKGWCVDIAAYYLFGRRSESPGDVWRDRYERAEADLDKVAQGKLTLGWPDPQGEARRQPVLFSARAGVFGGGGVL